MAGADAEDAVEGQVLFFPLTPLVTVTPPAIPAKRSSLLLVFDNDAAVPGFTSLPPVDAEELFSGFVFSTVCVLLIPDTLGTEPTLLLAFFILGCLFVMHLQANLPDMVDKILLKSQSTGRLAGSVVEHSTLGLRVVSSSPMLGVEIT